MTRHTRACLAGGALLAGLALAPPGLGAVAVTRSDDRVGSTPSSMAASDFDGDGASDLVTANFDSDNASMLLSNGSGVLRAARHFAAGTGGAVPSAAHGARGSRTRAFDLAVVRTAGAAPKVAPTDRMLLSATVRNRGRDARV